MGSTRIIADGELAESQEFYFPDTINLLWRCSLYHKQGSGDRFCGLAIYHDFCPWSSEIGHTQGNFRNGKRLAEEATRACPAGLRPAVLLTIADDVQEGPIRSGDFFILVVNIRRYLREAAGNAARTYLTSSFDIAQLASVEAVLSNPEAVEMVINRRLDLNYVARWISENEGRAEAVRQLLRPRIDDDDLTLKDVLDQLESLPTVGVEDIDALFQVCREQSPSSFASMLEKYINAAVVASWAQGNAARLEELRAALPAIHQPSPTSALDDVVHLIDSMDALSDEHVKPILMLLEKLKVKSFRSFLEWVLTNNSVDQIVQNLERLDVDGLRKLATVAGISSLKAMLVVWDKNHTNGNEEFWQQTLTQNPFLLSHLFCHPIVVVKGKAYVGGKGIENTGGNVLDFLCANTLTRNVTLVEIKTPETDLLSGLYRGDVYNVSSELSGAVLQVSNDKDGLTKEYDDLRRKSNANFVSFDPRCVVIAGRTNQLENERKIKSFELYRNGLKEVEVVTFDELFRKAADLLTLLEGPATSIDSVDE